MKKFKQIFLAIVTCLALIFTATACNESDADVASRNLSKAADQFEVPRRIVFINGITDKYLMSIEGLCSLGNEDKAGELSVTCKLEDGTFKKSFVGLSDNVTYVVQQLEGVNVSTTHYRVIFKPETILPDIDRP